MKIFLKFEVELPQNADHNRVGNLYAFEGRVGNLYAFEGVHYVLMQVDRSKVALMSMDPDGNRWNDGVLVADVYNLTPSEWREVWHGSRKAPVLVGRLQKVVS